MASTMPEIYLDPLLPLSVRRDPRVLPNVADLSARGLVVCCEGSCAVNADRNSHRVEAPGLVRIDLSKTPTMRNRPGRGWLLVLGGRLLDQLIVGAFGEPGFSRFLDELNTGGTMGCESFHTELDRLLDELSGELENRRAAFRVRARSQLTNILLLLYRAALVTPELRNGDALRLGAVLDHIELHHADELTLSELAGLMGMSPSHFSRLFRSEVGIPLFEYINRTRVRKACLLLKDPELSITRVAFDVGYNSVSFFNRYFRRVMNVTPREYRRYLTS